MYNNINIFSTHTLEQPIWTYTALQTDSGEMVKKLTIVTDSENAYNMVNIHAIGYRCAKDREKNDFHGSLNLTPIPPP